MGVTTDSNGRQGLISAADLPGLLPSRPILSNDEHGDGDMVLQHYQHPPFTIELPGLSSNSLIVSLGPPYAVEECTSGQAHERRWADRGRVSVLPIGQPVHRVMIGKANVVLIHFSPELVRAAAEDVFERDPNHVELVRRFVEADSMSDQLVRLLLQETATQAPGASSMVESLGRALAVHLVRCHSNLSPPLARPRVSMSGGQLRRVVEHMHAHIEESLPLARLAQVCRLSQSQFLRAFREATGEPPHRYLVRLRLQRARELLEHTELPVIEVGLRCGFEQASHFATAFRTSFGVSPRAWRLARRF